MKPRYVSVVLLLITTCCLEAEANLGKKSVNSFPPEALLSTGHYHTTCPDAEAIINQKVTAWFKKDPTLAPAIIPLHFHDCAVRGCDASILLNHTNGERATHESRTLRGFQVIDDIKAEVERKCPKTVSCADILTAAARDATILAGGPFWEVPFGRKDGRISIAREASLVPQGHENITALLHFFQELGLDILDLVSLSGSHTIGRSTCNSFMNRVYNFNGTGKPDPSLNVYYLKMLKRRCKRETDLVHLDAITPRTFDNVYYTNLLRKVGLLSTDQLLYSDSRTGPFVQAFATQPFLFSSQFAASMVKLGNVHVLTRPHEGEIRTNCNYVNPV
ncbi:peroxidase 7-like [Neltuma alba]|uniref:peroxidase 7-like n=1 Tax=Neltuma alba TaxID=207710 RepID=UPI0010A535A9|nr:peroxidase 7-like [Prosopis alba]XP_028799668.1 peroxidase 7-like [Prosopis alba]